MRIIERIGNYFDHDPWKRIFFAPWLNAAIWCGVIYAMGTNNVPLFFHSRFDEILWIITGLISPPLGLLAWYLVIVCHWQKSDLLGIYFRFAADIGIFIFLLSFFMSSFHCGCGVSEAFVMYQIMNVALIGWATMALMRDIWAIGMHVWVVVRAER